MEVLYFNQADTKSLLQSLIESRRLVPIIGAGFTKGESTELATVPDAENFKRTMISEIRRYKPELDQDKLSERSFEKVADTYFNSDVVPEDAVKAQLRKYFFKVNIPVCKKRFLNLGWKYVYTLNIDDAIEENSSLKPVLPYNDISEKTKDIGVVYKVHGDVVHELMYENDSRLIFSEVQYLRSLNNNKSMLLFLSTDYVDNNLLFIGCSLEIEVDILYALVAEDKEISGAARRIYVTSTEPDELRRLDLERYEINTVVVVDDYDGFYREVAEMGEKAEQYSGVVDNYSITNIRKLKADKNANIRFALNGPEEAHVVAPYYLAERNVERSIKNSLSRQPITIVKGRRFSGKTALLINIATTLRSKKVLFFPSSITLDDDAFEVALREKNTLIVFDTNVLTVEQAFFIKRKWRELGKKNSSVLIACNYSEVDVANVFAQLPLDEEFVFEIDNHFENSEVARINDKLSAIGVTNFLASPKTILDNAYRLKKEYPEFEAGIVSYGRLTDKDLTVLLLISVLDKLYFSMLKGVGVSMNEAETLVRHLEPVLIVEETTSEEYKHHSTHKVLANSKLWLMDIIRTSFSELPTRRVIKIILHIISSYRKSTAYGMIAKKIMMFDVLHQILGRRSGSLGRVNAIYEGLQDVLYDNPDYWLQRAKAIHKLEHENINKVLDGIHYAKKAYNDGDREKTVSNAEFMVALLYGRLCAIERYNKADNVIEAIKWFERALRNQSYNKSYIDLMLEKTKEGRGDFHKLAVYLTGGGVPPILLQYRQEINFILRFKK